MPLGNTEEYRKQFEANLNLARNNLAKSIEDSKKQTLGNTPTYDITDVYQPIPKDYYKAAPAKGTSGYIGMFGSGLGQAVGGVPALAGLAEKLVTGKDFDKTYGGRAAQAVEDYTSAKNVDPAIQESFSGKVTQGLGQAAGFLAGGLAGGASKLGTAGMLAAGSGMSGKALYDDAISKGADEDTAYSAALQGALIGTSEALPFLSAANRFLGGKTRGLVKALGSAAITGGEELLQEGLQTLGENAVAKVTAGYDPDRAWFESVSEAAAVGGTTGFIADIILNTLGRKLHSGPTLQVDKGENGDLTYSVNPNSDLGKAYELSNQKKAEGEQNRAQYFDSLDYTKIPNSAAQARGDDTTVFTDQNIAKSAAKLTKYMDAVPGSIAYKIKEENIRSLATNHIFNPDADVHTSREAIDALSSVGLQTRHIERLRDKFLKEVGTTQENGEDVKTKVEKLKNEYADNLDNLSYEFTPPPATDSSSIEYTDLRQKITIADNTEQAKTEAIGTTPEGVLLNKFGKPYKRKDNTNLKIAMLKKQGTEAEPVELPGGKGWGIRVVSETPAIPTPAQPTTPVQQANSPITETSSVTPTQDITQVVEPSANKQEAGSPGLPGGLATTYNTNSEKIVFKAASKEAAQKRIEARKNVDNTYDKAIPVEYDGGWAIDLNPEVQPITQPTEVTQNGQETNANANEVQQAQGQPIPNEASSTEGQGKQKQGLLKTTKPKEPKQPRKSKSFAVKKSIQVEVPFTPVNTIGDPVFKAGGTHPTTGRLKHDGTNFQLEMEDGTWTTPDETIQKRLQQHKAIDASMPRAAEGQGTTITIQPAQKEMAAEEDRKARILADEETRAKLEDKFIANLNDQYSDEAKLDIKAAIRQAQDNAANNIPDNIKSELAKKYGINLPFKAWAKIANGLKTSNDQENQVGTVQGSIQEGREPKQTNVEGASSEAVTGDRVLQTPEILELASPPVVEEKPSVPTVEIKPAPEDTIEGVKSILDTKVLDTNWFKKQLEDDFNFGDTYLDPRSDNEITFGSPEDTVEQRKATLAIGNVPVYNALNRGSVKPKEQTNKEILREITNLDKDLEQTTIDELAKDGIVPFDDSNIDPNLPDWVSTVNAAVSKKQVSLAIDRFINAVKAAGNTQLKFVVHDTLENYQTYLENNPREAGGLRYWGFTPGGFFLSRKNEIHILAFNHVTAEQATKTLIHETVGHYGMEAMFGNKFIKFVQRLADTNPKLLRQAYNKLAKTYKVEGRKPIGRERLKDGERFVTDVNGNKIAILNADETHTLMKEYIARLSEDYSNPAKRAEMEKGALAAIKRIYAYIKHILRPYVNFEVTDEDVHALIRESYARVMNEDGVSFRNRKSISDYDQARIRESEGVSNSFYGRIMPGGQRGTDYVNDQDTISTALHKQELTTKTLSKLPNKPVILRGTIKQLLNQPDVRAADKALINGVLDTEFADMEKIDRQRFIAAVESRLLPLEINIAHSQTYANYGLANIGRTLGAPMRGAQTHVWDAPFTTPKDVNHFGDPNYMGHTRTFIDSDGKYYVSEVQSDVVQKAKFSKEERTEKDITNLKIERKRYLDVLRGVENYFYSDNFTKIKEVIEGDISNPIFEDIIIDEPNNQVIIGIDAYSYTQTAYKIRERANDKLLKIKAELDTSPIPKGYEQFKPVITQRLAREEIRKAAEDGYNEIRFPTGDTATKIERWATDLIPDQSGYSDKIKIGEYQGGINLATGKWKVDSNGKFFAETTDLGWMLLPAYENIGVRSRLKPEYQGLFNIYDKELRSFLTKEYGAKEVTDEAGHTWFEVSDISKYASEPVIAFNINNQISLSISANPQEMADVMNEPVENVIAFHEMTKNHERQIPFLSGFSTFAKKVQKAVDTSTKGAFDLFGNVANSGKLKTHFRNALGYSSTAQQLSDQVTRSVFNNKKIGKTENAEIRAAWLSGDIHNGTFNPTYLTPLQTGLLQKLSKELARIQQDVVEGNFAGISDEMKNKILSTQGSWLHKDYLATLDKGYIGHGWLTSALDWKKKSTVPEDKGYTKGLIADSRYSILNSVNLLARDTALLQLYDNIVKDSKALGTHWVISTGDKHNVNGNNYTLQQIRLEISDLEQILAQSETVTLLTPQQEIDTQARLEAFKTMEKELDSKELLQVREAMIRGGSPYSILDAASKPILDRDGKPVGNNLIDLYGEKWQEIVNKYRTDNYKFIKPNKYPNLGNLRGYWIDKRIFDVIVSESDYVKNASKNWAETIFSIAPGSALDRANSLWKGHMTVMNPTYWVRNFFGAGVIMDLASNTNSGTLTRYLWEETHNAFIKEADETQPIYGGKTLSQWGIEKGLFSTGFSANELYAIRYEIKKSGAADSFSESLEKGEYKDSFFALGGMMKNGYFELGKFLANKNISMDAMFKLALMRDYLEIHAKQKGFSSITAMTTTYDKENKAKLVALMENAAAYAGKGIFEYHDIPKWMQTMRRLPLGAPFLTFNYKMFGAVQRAALARPWKLIKYQLIGYGIFQALLAASDWDEDELKKAIDSLPVHMRNKSTLYIIPFKDQSGNIHYADLSYMLPQAFIYDTFLKMANPTPGQSQVGAVGSALAETTGILSGPIPKVLTAIIAKKDPFTGRDLWVDGDSFDSNLARYSKFMWNLAAPPWAHADLFGAGTGGGILSDTYNVNFKDEFGKDKNPYWSTDVASFISGTNIKTYRSRDQTVRNMRFITAKVKEIELQRSKVMKNQNLSMEDKVSKLKDISERIRELNMSRSKYSGA